MRLERVRYPQPFPTLSPPLFYTAIAVSLSSRVSQKALSNMQMNVALGRQMWLYTRTLAHTNTLAPWGTCILVMFTMSARITHCGLQRLCVCVWAAELSHWKKFCSWKYSSHLKNRLLRNYWKYGKILLRSFNHSNWVLLSFGRWIYH